jgi:hypothetical protein
MLHLPAHWQGHRQRETATRCHPVGRVTADDTPAPPPRRPQQRASRLTSQNPPIRAPIAAADAVAHFRRAVAPTGHAQLLLWAVTAVLPAQQPGCGHHITPPFAPAPQPRRFWHDEKRFRGSGDESLAQHTLLAAGVSLWERCVAAAAARTRASGTICAHVPQPQHACGATPSRARLQVACEWAATPRQRPHKAPWAGRCRNGARCGGTEACVVPVCVCLCVCVCVCVCLSMHDYPVD